MKKIKLKWVFSCLSLLGIMLWFMPTNVYAQKDCIFVFPLDEPDFCGCTWGTVLYDGISVVGSHVEMEYEGRTLSYDTGDVLNGETQEPRFPYPAYMRSAFFLSADRGDLLTLSASYAGQTVSRTVRALPGFEPPEMYVGSDIEGNSEIQDALQHVTLVIPDQGVWTAQGAVDVGAVNDVVLAGDAVWVAGANGVSERGADGTLIASHLGGMEIERVAIGANGDVWALDAALAQLHHYSGTTWTMIEGSPLEEMEAVAVMSDGTIIVGGVDEDSRDKDGAIVSYGGEWGQITHLTHTVRAVAVDKSDTIWAGTDKGVYRIDPSSDPILLTEADGLPTDKVTHIESTGDFVYVGGPWSGKGILGRYNLTTDEWFSWDGSSNLPADVLIDLAVESVDGKEIAFAVTRLGVHQLVAPNFWRTYTVEESSVVVAAGGSGAIAAGANLHQFDAEAYPGEKPTATISETTLIDTTFVLSGSGTEDEGDDSHIVGWEWMSGETLMCNSASCEVRRTELETELCQEGASVPFTFRVQDDEGEWSEVASTSLQIEDGQCPPTAITLQDESVRSVSMWQAVTSLLVGMGVVTLFLCRRRFS